MACDGDQVTLGAAQAPMRTMGSRSQIRITADHTRSGGRTKARRAWASRLLFFAPTYSWLYRTTLNVYLEFLRARHRRSVTSSQLEELTSSRYHRPDDVIVARRGQEALCQSADGRDLEILVSHFVLGCDQTEIANQLGISRRAVVKRLTKLRGGTALTERTTLNG
jgi:CRP-like cAMP-binding protein